LIDTVCDRYEAARKLGWHPDLRAYLTEAPPAVGSELLRELLRVELDYRVSENDWPAQQEYFARFPEHAPIIRAVFEELTERDYKSSVHSSEDIEVSEGAAWLPVRSESGKQSDPLIQLFASQPRGDTHRIRDTATRRYELTPGTAFGDYDILEELGIGGMGIVYRARQRSADRIVALKVLREDKLACMERPADREEWLKRFLREARSAARVHHEHVVEIYDAGECNGWHYYSMRFVEGRTLKAMLSDGAIPCRQAAEYMRCIARAVQAIHGLDIVHRDLNPRNILVDQSDRPFVTDFGLAKCTADSDGMTGYGVSMGTPSYQSPEQAKESAKAGPASDIYSLGAILYELLVRRPPFCAAEAAVTLRQVITDEAIRPSRLNPAVDRPLELICLKCLQKEPRARYQTAEQLAGELDRYLRGERLAFTRPISLLTQAVRWCGKNRLLASVGAFAAVLAITIVVLGVRYELYLAATNAKLAEKTTYWALDRGMSLCEHGDIGQGMLWLECALDNAPDGPADLPGCIRANLGTWQRQINGLRAVLPHDDLVQAIAYSPDGNQVLTGGAGWVRLWDAQTGQRRGEPLRHRGIVQGLAFRPDGKAFLTVSSDGTAQLWDSQTAFPLGRPIKHNAKFFAVAFRPDGKRVLIASSRHAARQWDPVTGEADGPPLEHNADVQSVAFSPDGTRIVTGSCDGTARLWDAATGKPLLEPLRHEGDVKRVAFAPNGKLVLTGSKDNSARIWEVATGKRVVPPLVHLGTVLTLAWSPDSTLVLTGSADKTARLWLAGTGKPLGAAVPHEHPVYCVAFSPDGRRFITGTSGGDFRLWDTTSQVPLGSRLRHPGLLPQAVFSPDGQNIVTGNTDNTARIWALSTATPVLASLPHRGAINSVTFSPDGKTLVTAGIDHAAHLWDAATGLPVGSPLLHGERIVEAAFSPDGKIIATAGRDGFVKLWSSSVGTPFGLSLRHDNWVHAVAFSPDGRTLLTGSEDRSARLWDVTTGVLRGNPLQHEGPVFSVAYSPDGTKVLTGSGDNTAQLWEATTGAPFAPALGHDGWITAVAFRPDGRIAATGSMDHTARLWEVATGRSVSPPLEHGGRVHGLAFSANSKILLTVSADKTARAWDAGTGKPAGPTLVHPRDVFCGVLSYDGSMAITACADGCVRCWHVPSGRIVGPVFSHRGPVSRVALSPDGTKILSGDTNDQARLWESPVSTAVDSKQLQIWTKVATGLDLDATGSVRELDYQAWAELRNQLDSPVLLQQR
jgi:WD40 repeat protein